MKDMENIEGRCKDRKKQAREKRMLQRYADVISDTVFKRLFGDEKFPDLLLYLLRHLIPERKISSIVYTSQEHQSAIPEGHGIRIDVECYESETGARFAVEMQALRTEHFHDRLLLYSTYIIQEQHDVGVGIPLEEIRNREKGEKYSYAPSYVIALMNYDDNKGSAEIKHEYAITDLGDRHLMTDKIKYITLELPKYHEPIDSPAATVLDKFCYALHNMTTFERRPKYQEGKFFEMLFERAEIAKFTPQEVMKYERDMLTQWDIDDLRETVRHEARAEGLAEGRAEGRAEGLLKGIDRGRSESLAMVAQNLLKSGMKPEDVAHNTTLSVEKVLEIQRNL